MHDFVNVLIIGTLCMVALYIDYYYYHTRRIITTTNIMVTLANCVGHFIIVYKYYK